MAGEGKRRLERAVDGMISNKQDKLVKIPALLGVYIDGVKTIVVAGRPDFVWCRVRGSISDIVMAFNETVGEHWDLPILIFRDPDAPDLYKVHGRDPRVYPDWGGEFYSSRPHGRSHSFGRPEGNDPVWIYKRQQMALLPRPLISGTLGIYIEPEFYYFDGTYRWWPGSGTTSLAGYKPTGSYNGRFVTVYIDGNTGNPNYLSGPEFNAYVPPLDPIAYVSLPTPDQGIPIAAVFLITGTERIGWGEIYDLRLTVAPVPGTGSNLHVYDEGSSLGMVGSMNFIGDNVEAIVSGSFAWISVTGSAPATPITGSVTVYDESVLLGQADAINVVGAEVEVVLSGTTAHIMHTGTALTVPVTGSVMIADEDVLLGSVLGINFTGDNVEAVISGSWGHIMHTGTGGGGGGGTGSILIEDEGILQGAADTLDFLGAGVSVVLDGDSARITIPGFIAGSGSTYVRAGQAVALYDPTSQYWRIPEGEYVTGSLAVGVNGVWQIPVIDYTEQFPSSGTFQLGDSPQTGTVVGVVWGAPAGSDNLISLYDEGVFLGDVSALDIVGDDVEAVVSGSFGYVMHSGSGGGASDFLALDDTPASYSGQSGTAVVVNESEDALEFVNRVPGALVQYFFATGTTDIGRAAASWADMDQMIITGTFGIDNTVEIHFSFGVGGSSVNNVGAFQIAVDGVGVGEGTNIRTPVVSVGPAGHLMWMGNLPGTRVITGQWWGGGPGTTHNRPSGQAEHRNLLVKEYQG